MPNLVKTLFPGFALLRMHDGGHHIGTSFFDEMKILGSCGILLGAWFRVVLVGSGWFWLVLANLEGSRGLGNVSKKFPTITMFFGHSSALARLEACPGCFPCRKRRQNASLASWSKPLISEVHRTALCGPGGVLPRLPRGGKDQTVQKSEYRLEHV